VALRSQIVDLVGLHLLDDADEAGAVRQVTVMQDEFAVGLMRVLVEMIDAIGVEQRGAALDAVDFVAFAQQEFGEIGAVLPGNAGDERFLGHVSEPTTVSKSGIVLSFMRGCHVFLPHLADLARDTRVTGLDARTHRAAPEDKSSVQTGSQAQAWRLQLERKAAYE